MPESLALLGAGWPWLICSVFVAIITSNLAWLFRNPHSNQLGQSIANLRAKRFTPWIVEILRLLYFAGLPFAALFWGHDAIIGRVMGLQPVAFPLVGSESTTSQIPALWADWTRDGGWAIAIAVAAWIVLALGWGSYRRALQTDDLTESSTPSPISGWALLRDAAYYEIHWAFYRSIAVVAFGAYSGTWIGLALTAIEAALCPAWRQSFLRREEAPMSLAHAMLSFSSGLLYLLTENLWLAIAMHWLVIWGFSQIIQLSAKWMVQTTQTEGTQQEIGTP
ncbi:MAG: hypothetical protein MUQ10_09360 [Anaerolineae bacterium]|nr:hypothetical protein [Anaerolineae bacterium]